MAKGVGCVCGGLVARLWKQRFHEDKKAFGSDDCIHSLDWDDTSKDVYTC